MASYGAAVIGAAAFGGLLLLGLMYMPGGVYLVFALLAIGFCAEFIVPFFIRGRR